MVRHHVKNKNKKSKQAKQKEKDEEQKSALKDLGRFAGSSEEENEDAALDTDDESVDSVDVEVQQQQQKMKKQQLQRRKPSNSAIEKGEEADDDDSDGDDSSDEDEYNGGAATKTISRRKKTDIDDDDDDEEDDVSSDDDMMALQSKSHNKRAGERGMAGAMSKILGLAAFDGEEKKNNKQVVLSKTVTPLQKLQKKEKDAADALRSKKKERREVNLLAMHLPLSSATSRPPKNSDDDVLGSIASSMAKEIEMESMHRRVATRGVVALFNTIAQHQQQRVQEQAETSIIASNKKSSEVKNMSKHGFLDMLKKTGTSNGGDSTDNNDRNSSSNSGSAQSGSKERTKKDKGSGGWNALKDDFMMNSKLKDWDKELSDDDEENDDTEDEADTKNSKKRGSGDADAMMDDDFSSSDEEEVPVATKRRKR